VFTRPLPLTVQSCEDESTIIMASSSLLFNLGLTCHSLYADQRTISASRVAKCYNLALTITCRFTSNNGINAVVSSTTWLISISKNVTMPKATTPCSVCKRWSGLDAWTDRQPHMKHDVDELKLNLLCLKKPTAARAA
jgi:hypothetical protein